jgi:NADH-quinone oxidoreductase subunit N
MIFYIFPDIFLCFWLLVMGLLIFVMWDRRTSDDAGQLMIFATAQGLVIELFFLYHTLYRDFNAVFYSNNLFFYSKIFIVFIALLCIIIISVFFRSRHVLYFEFAILFLISVQGMLWMLSANDLFSIYLFFELQAFCFYILVGMHHSTRSAEASLRYFIYGSFSSAIFLLGISFIYGFFGTCEFSKLLLLCDYDVIDLRSSGLLIFGLLCIFVGLFFKLGIVPFHI